MITVLALAAAQAADAPAIQAAPPEDEIVVIGQRLKAWRATWRRQGEGLVCMTRRSTGDAAIDAIGCDAMVQCLSPLVPQIDAIGQTKEPRKQQAKKMNALIEQQIPCLEAARTAGIARLAQQRRGK